MSARAAVFAVALLGCLTVSAATIKVTNTKQSGTGSFAAAMKSAQDGDTIAFSLAATENVIVVSDDGFTIDQDRFPTGLTIDGSNSGRGCVFTGACYQQMFYINAGNAITFKNVEFRDSADTVILNCGRLMVDGCSFYGNYSTSLGGAIYNLKNTAIIVNSSFVGNVAKEDGGAICANGTNLICNCTFIGNSAGRYGGAVYEPSAPYDSPEVNLVNSVFIDNTGVNAVNGMDYYGGVCFAFNCIFSRGSLGVIREWRTQFKIPFSDVYEDDAVTTNSHGKAYAAPSPWGKAVGSGVWVFHNADWSSVALSDVKSGSDKKAVRGNVDECTIRVELDQLGASIGGVPSIGSVFCAPGEPSIEVTARQRYPWNGKVDVVCNLQDGLNRDWWVELTAMDAQGGTNLPMRTFEWSGVKADGRLLLKPGESRIVWCAGADLPKGRRYGAVEVSATTKESSSAVWSFDDIPAADPDDEWSPNSVYHDIQTVVGYGEVENHAPNVRCLTDAWELEDQLGGNVVFSGTSMALRYGDTQMRNRGCEYPLVLWAHSDSSNVFRMVTLDYETGKVVYDNASSYKSYPDIRFFTEKKNPRAYAIVNRKTDGSDIELKSANTDRETAALPTRFGDQLQGSAVCAYFFGGMPFSTESGTSYPSDQPTGNAALFCAGLAGTDVRQVVLKTPSPGSLASSTYSCMKDPVGRYVVPLLDPSIYFTVGNCYDGGNIPQCNGVMGGSFADFEKVRFDLCHSMAGAVQALTKSYTKGVAMPDGKRIFLGGDGRSDNGRVRMWTSSVSADDYCDYPKDHAFESPHRRDLTCLLPNGKFCGVDEKLGLVVVNPLTGEWYVASDDPAFKVGKMGCQLLPNGKVLIIPYNAADDRTGNLDVCGKLYEVDFGFTRSFTLSTLMSPYVRVAEGEPEPSGVRITLNPNGGTCDTIAVYRTGGNPTYGTLPTPTREGYAFRGWGASATATTAVSSGDAVPQSGVVLYAMWGEALYMVVDLSGGKDATSYPVSYLSDVPSGGWTDTYKTTKMVLRKIEPGSIACRKGPDRSDSTKYTIKLTKPYFIGVFEVTQKQYELVMGSNPSPFTGSTRPVSKVSFAELRHAVNRVWSSSEYASTWPKSADVSEASFFGKLRTRTSLGLDLPTVCQWEYACRGGRTSNFNNGGDLSSSDDRSNSSLNSVGWYWYKHQDNTAGTKVVGSFSPNQWGLYDMHGNVSEICLDLPQYGGISQGQTFTDYVGETYPWWGDQRVIRGGAWNSFAYECDASYSTRYPSSREGGYNFDGIGFRICLPLEK